MAMHEITVNGLASGRAVDAAEQAFEMTEEAFRVFYESTARPLYGYLARATGDRRLADDLLQEAYYRFLRAGVTFESDDHRRHYLFRIATNLVRDQRRRPRVETPAIDLDTALTMTAGGDTADRAARRIDLLRAMAQLKPRERSLLWLAYAQGCSHAEIAQTLGVKTASLKALLHRARRRLARLMGGRA